MKARYSGTKTGWQLYLQQTAVLLLQHKQQHRCYHPGAPCNLYRHLEDRPPGAPCKASKQEVLCWHSPCYTLSGLWGQYILQQLPTAAMIPPFNQQSPRRCQQLRLQRQQ